jgi:dihydroflavonol-4-reductase
LRSGVSWVHVDDVATGIVRALSAGEPGEDYILGGDNYTIGELLRRLAPLTGIRAPLIGLPTKIVPAAFPLEVLLARALGLPRGVIPDGYRTLNGSVMFSSEKARKTFGYSWRPVEEGIVETVRALRAE